MYELRNQIESPKGKQSIYKDPATGNITKVENFAQNGDHLGSTTYSYDEQRRLLAYDSNHFTPLQHTEIQYLQTSTGENFAIAAYYIQQFDKTWTLRRSNCAKLFIPEETDVPMTFTLRPIETTGYYYARLLDEEPRILNSRLIWCHQRSQSHGRLEDSARDQSLITRNGTIETDLKSIGKMTIDGNKYLHSLTLSLTPTIEPKV